MRHHRHRVPRAVPRHSLRRRYAPEVPRGFIVTGVVVRCTAVTCWVSHIQFSHGGVRRNHLVLLPQGLFIVDSVSHVCGLSHPQCDKRSGSKLFKSIFAGRSVISHVPAISLPPAMKVNNYVNLFQNDRIPVRLGIRSAGCHMYLGMLSTCSHVSA